MRIGKTTEGANVITHMLGEPIERVEKALRILQDLREATGLLAVQEAAVAGVIQELEQAADDLKKWLARLREIQRGRTG